MFKIKPSLLTFWLILTLSTAYSQKADYIKTDSTIKTGVKLISGQKGNFQFIKQRVGTDEILYTPKQLIEYGFKNGSVFQSKTISISGDTKKVFLERLTSGKMNLYYYTDREASTFFIEKDSANLIDLGARKNFRSQLQQQTSDFDWKMDQVRLVKYKRKSLDKLVSMYNDGKNRPIPYGRFGFVVGYSIVNVTIPKTRSNLFSNRFEFNPVSTATAGIFIDLPIEMSYFSLNLGTNLVKSSFSASIGDGLTEQELELDILSINFPILLRYTIPTLKWRPFVNTGIVYSHNLENESIITETDIDQNTETTEEELVSSSMFGVSLGSGVQYQLSRRNIISGELRYTLLLSGSSSTFDINQFEVLMSFSF